MDHETLRHYYRPKKLIWALVWLLINLSPLLFKGLESDNFLKLLWFLGLMDFLIAGWFIVLQAKKLLYQAFTGLTWVIVLGLLISYLFHSKIRFYPPWNVFLGWPALVSGLILLICNFCAPFLNVKLVEENVKKIINERYEK